jgi:hypothetical protein
VIKLTPETVLDVDGAPLDEPVPSTLLRGVSDQRRVE